MPSRKLFAVKKLICMVLCMVLILAASPLTYIEAAVPSITVDASKNEGVYSPNTIGNMWEWAHNYMNGAWAEKAVNRNFEGDSVNAFIAPLYDHFSGGALERSKWTPKLLGGSTSGSYSVSGTQLTLNGGSNSRYGLLSRIVPNAKYRDTTVKSVILLNLGLRMGS